MGVGGRSWLFRRIAVSVERGQIGRPAVSDSQVGRWRGTAWVRERELVIPGNDDGHSARMLRRIRAEEILHSIGNAVAVEIIARRVEPAQLKTGNPVRVIRRDRVDVELQAGRAGIVI